MNNYKVVFILDKVEFQYFEFNRLVTSFWLVKECCDRGWDVYISTADRLTLENNQPKASLFKISFEKANGKMDLIREKEAVNINLNDMDIVFFRPDPPIDINYIQCTYILDFIDTTKTLVVNSASGVRKANEKVYINNFSEYVPDNIVSKNIPLLKDFLNQYEHVIVKPLNKCFGKGVFSLKKGDPNTNSILETSTDFGSTLIMVQEYVNTNGGGDKRVNIICGEVMEEAVTKLSGKGDFKFNAHNDEFFVKSYLTDKEKEICTQIAPKLMSEGLYIVGLDFIQDKMIEINVTSPCFFIREINKFFDIELEKRIIDLIANTVESNKQKKLIDQSLTVKSYTKI